MTLLGNGIAAAIGFICGVYWLKWSGSAWVLLPMFAPWGGVLIGSLFALIDPENNPSS
jgi:hypothetical protein